jgi:hypothetical protein
MKIIGAIATWRPRFVSATSNSEKKTKGLIANVSRVSPANSSKNEK